MVQDPHTQMEEPASPQADPSLNVESNLELQALQPSDSRPEQSDASTHGPQGQSEAAGEAGPVAEPHAADDASSRESAPKIRSSEPVDIVAGTLHAVEGGQTVVVELPGKISGVIPITAFEKLPRIGTRLEFVIEAASADEQGRVHLRLAEADEKVTWKNLEVGAIIDAMVTGMNTGGLELKIAGSKIRAFMPSSQIDLDPNADPTQFLSHKLPVKVISLEKRRRRVVVSRRAIQEREHRRKRLKEIKAGDIFEGKVRRFEEFGVFVDLEPGLDGLVRFGDLAWHHVEDPSAVVQIGQAVKVKVLRIERGRLTLGIRQLLPNPWDEVATKYPPGNRVRGKVVRTTDFGAFIELEPGIEGMIHISQLSERRVDTVEKVVREGQFIDSKVIEVDPRKQRIALSIRALTAPDEGIRAPQASREEIRKYVKPAAKAKAVESLMAKWGEATGLKGGIG